MPAMPGRHTGGRSPIKFFEQSRKETKVETINKAEITEQLRNMTEERLFGDKSWPIDDHAAVHQQLIAWGLLEENQTGTYAMTALGRELSVDYWMVFMGHHELREIPTILVVDYGLLTEEEVDNILIDQCDRDGEKLEDILPPILRRLYAHGSRQHRGDHDPLN
jgi:hypothetical protein